MRIQSAEFIKGIRGTDPIFQDGIPQIAFVGRSNVGKSSLINALVDSRDLVKTGKKPGKTREINFFKINKKVYFVDLPGYGYAAMNPREKEKIRKLILWYFCYSDAKPQNVVLILDIKAGLTRFDKEMLELLHGQKHPYFLVVNKTDKLGQKELTDKLALIKKDSGGAELLPCSAKIGTGIEAILEKLLAPSLHIQG